MFSDSLFHIIDELYQAIGSYESSELDREELLDALVILRKIQYKYDGLTQVQFTNEQWRRLMSKFFDRAREREYGYAIGNNDDFYEGVNIHDE